MNAPLTRRALLGGTAALGAVALPVAACAALVEPDACENFDAELFDLLAQHPVAVMRWQGAKRVVDDLEIVAVAHYPARSAALEYRQGDLGGRGFALADPSDAVDEDGARTRWYSTRGVFWLKYARPLESWSTTAHAMVADPVAEARRAEILTAAQEWQVACEDVERRTGFTASVEVFDAAMEALDAIESRVILLLPHTVSGIIAKASWATASASSSIRDQVLKQIADLQVAV